MEPFTRIHWKRDILEALGLPDIGYPVPPERLESLLEVEQLDYRELLYRLQEYSAEHPDEWVPLEEAILGVARLIAPADDRQKVSVAGDTWSLVCSPIDLRKEIVTVQRQGCLIAAMRPRKDGRLRISTYRPLDAKSVRYLIGLSLNPHPDHGVCMRPNNWENAIDCSAMTGNCYADREGAAYLSYWQFGLGVSADHQLIEVWRSQQMAIPIPAPLTAVQLEVYYTYSPEYAPDET
jgi:hypothetical protein